jgi:hypothetical protein
MTKAELHSEIDLLNDIVYDLTTEVRELRKDNKRYAKFIEALGMYTTPEVTR